MTKGTFLHNTWILGAIALIILAIVATVASLNGGIALDIGGMQLTFAPQDDGSVHLSLLNLGRV